MIAGMHEPERFSGRYDFVVHTEHEFGRYIQFPTQLADVRDARRPHQRVSQFYLPARRKRKSVVAHVRRRQRLQQIPRARSHNGNDAHGGTNIC